MNKILVLVIGLLLLGNVAQAACLANNYICYDDTGLYFNTSPFRTMTLAQMNSATPGYVGQQINVSDGVQSKVCISSGTGNGAYTVLQATAPGAGALQHCS